MINIVPTGGRALTGKSLVLAAVGAVVLGTVTGVAYAAWSVSATGSSEAKSGTPVTGTVTASTANGDLYPGGDAPVYFTVSNPNSFPVTYTQASFGTITVDDATACPASNITVTTTAVSISLAAGATSTVQTPAGAVALSSAAPDGCQGRTFTIATTLTGTSG